MYKIKKVSFIFLLAVGLLAYFAQANLIRAQDATGILEDIPKDSLQFSVDGGKIYFFQPQTGRIFVYQTTTNRFNRLLTLEELGQDLKQSRSLSIIEKEKED